MSPPVRLLCAKSRICLSETAWTLVHIRVQFARRQAETVKLGDLRRQARRSFPDRARNRPSKPDLRGFSSASAIESSVNFSISARTSSATSAADSFFVCVRVPKNCCLSNAPRETASRAVAQAALDADFLIQTRRITAAEKRIQNSCRIIEMHCFIAVDAPCMILSCN